MAAYEAICALLYRRCLDGATALLGVDGLLAAPPARPDSSAAGPRCR